MYDLTKILPKSVAILENLSDNEVMSKKPLKKFRVAYGPDQSSAVGANFVDAVDENDAKRQVQSWLKEVAMNYTDKVLYAMEVENAN